MQNYNSILGSWARSWALNILLKIHNMFREYLEKSYYIMFFMIAEEIN